MRDDFSGVIPRLEPKRAQVALVQQASSIRTVMIDEYRVSQFLHRGLDGNTLDTKVILSSTFNDEKLEDWFVDRELEVALDIGADAIVPCDCPVYRDDARSFRVEAVQNYVNDLADAIPRFRDRGIKIIPLVKGESSYERGLCYDLFDDYGITDVAYYCVQYFSYGYRLTALLNRVSNIAVEYDPENIMLIGLQSENLLPRFPPNVTAAAGQRWLWTTDVGDVPTEVAAQQYEKWTNEVKAALSVGQVPLAAYTGERGWA